MARRRTTTASGSTARTLGCRQRPDGRLPRTSALGEATPRPQAAALLAGRCRRCPEGSCGRSCEPTPASSTTSSPRRCGAPSTRSLWGLNEGQGHGGRARRVRLLTVGMAHRSPRHLPAVEDHRSRALLGLKESEAAHGRPEPAQPLRARARYPLATRTASSSPTSKATS
jgi:hypothetical protein